MSIRLDVADNTDFDYVQENGLPEIFNEVLDDVLAKKPEKENVSSVMATFLAPKPKPSRFLKIGNTPLVEVPSPNPLVKIFVKCEFVNPTGSIKDRIAQHMLSVAEAEGKIIRGKTTVIAASSGNTGSAIAMACSTRGLKCKIFTNSKCSKEKIDAVKAFGGEIIVGPTGIAADHPDHYQNLAVAAARQPDTFDVDQYDNQRNPEAYYKSLGPEIWDQTEGKVTHFIAAGSTGGTISGVGKYLKEQNSDIKVILSDPHGSCFSDYYKTGDHTGASSFLIEGVGKDSIPGAMNFGIVDYAIQISDAQAVKTCHDLACNEGLLTGGSSGLNVAAAREIAMTLTEPATIVTICPDTGLKYLSKYYNDQWLEEQGVHLDEERYLSCKRYKAPMVWGPEMKCPDLNNNA
ncbi:Cystathionine beta-synthase [Diplonema papillatum]|nr:Cystathionine beta-synthase [Diplonema papillatum]